MNVYDFDHTIYRGDSSIDFFFFVLRRRPWLAVLLPVQVWGMLLYAFRLISKEAMKSHFFCFVRFIDAESMAQRFWEKHRRNIQPWYLRQRRDSDVIISASPEFLLEPVVTGFLHCALIASKVDPKTGVYNGKNCYGEEKARRFRERYGDEKIDNFFSDDYADMPLMRAAENAFLVKGDTIMKAEL